jgi:hypothetical protein
MTKTRLGKPLAILIALVMLMSLLPTQVLAVDTEGEARANNAPVVIGDATNPAYASVDAGETYALDLGAIFRDDDGDTLTYTVSVNGNAPVNAAVIYSYSPAQAGTTTLAFVASDGQALSEAYDVILTAAEALAMDAALTDGFETTLTFKVKPSTVNVTFYATTGYDVDGYDLYDASAPLTASDGGVSSGYHIYTVTIPAGVSTISFRGADSNGSIYGGMSVDISEATAAGEITLHQLDAYVTTQISGAYTTPEQAVVAVRDANYHAATCGGTYASSGITHFRFLLYAGGNAELYTYFSKPQGDTALTYGTLAAQNRTVMPNGELNKIRLKLPLLHTYTVTAPSGADVRIFDQLRNFNTAEIVETGSTDNGNGTTTHTFRLPSDNGNLTYRVSLNGHITKAGYMPSVSDDGGMTVSWSESDAAPTTRVNNVSSGVLAARLEESVLLNVNSQNCLKLDAGETFRLRAYRIWQIINSDTANIMIEPDFHFKVISGEDVVSIHTVTEGNGNASGNWLDITAQKQGIAIIEIGYDAIDIGGSTSYTGVYAASDPQRTGLVVVQVGSSGSDIDLGVGNWDVEYDTLYFNGASGLFKLTPSASGGITSVAVLNQPTTNSEWTTLTASVGSYTAVITPGNNLLRITAGDTVEYQVVRGASVTTEISNLTVSGQMGYPGNDLKISFHGLYIPMPKFSGIYNPGYNYAPGSDYGHYLRYTIPAGLTLKEQEHVQYHFVSSHAVTLSCLSAGTYTLTGGYVYFSMMGISVPLNGHRTLTDGGVGANFVAVNTYHARSILPDVVLTVESETLPELKVRLQAELDALYNAHDASYYTAGNWAAVQSAYETGTSGITGATTHAEASAAFETAADIIRTIQTATALAAAKAAAVSALEAAFALYNESDYSAANWAKLVQAREAGRQTIEAALTPADVNAALNSALSAMAAIETISQEDDEDTQLPDFGPVVGSIHIIVENQTFKNAASDGSLPAWSGTLIDGWYELCAEDTMMTAILKALQLKGCDWSTGSQGNASSWGDYSINYLASIKVPVGVTADGGDFQGNGILNDGILAEFSGEQGSGWMGTLNDWFVNEGFNQFAVSDEELGDGDEIHVMYTNMANGDLGSDIGGSWFNADTSLRSLTFSAGVLKPSFASSTLDYGLIINGESLSFKVTPSASNKNFLVKTFLNRYNSNAAYYKRTATLTVKPGDTIFVGCGDNSWPSMNNQEEEAVEYTGTTYVIKVFESEEEYLKAQDDAQGGAITLTPAVTATNGTASVTLSDADLADAIKEVRDNGGNIIIAPKITGTANKVTVDLPISSLTTIAAETNAALTFETPVGSMTLPNTVLDSIAAQATGGTVTMSLETVALSKLTADQQAAVGDNPVYDISILSGGKHISSFGGSSITISLPYTLKDGETGANVTVWYLNDVGELAQMTCTYDKATGLAAFTTTHLSYFVVGYSAEWVNPFTDVKSTDWFYSAVKYVSQNSLMSGTTATTFEPNTSMTRAMLVTVLYRLEGKPAVTGTNSFADVKSGEWYTDAVLWANMNNIVTGFGGDLFGTNDVVTREQLAAILYRYAQYKGYDVTKTASLTAFTDAGSISSWAQTAVQWAVAEGLITGTTATALSPATGASRGTVATILMRFIENITK